MVWQLEHSPVTRAWQRPDNAIVKIINAEVKIIFFICKYHLDRRDACPTDYKITIRGRTAVPAVPLAIFIILITFLPESLLASL